jgi:radical SAM protein with 4Fe4S-binding SPASM domain
MLHNSIARIPEKIPLLNRLYKRNAALLKRNWCLFLNRRGLLKPVSFVMWLTTYRCSMGCPYCEASAGAQRVNELSTREAKDFIDDLAGMGAKRLCLSGGEPLERPDIVELMHYGHAKGLDFGLASNGYHLPRLWNELNKLRYFTVFVSLDGTPEYHNAIRKKPQAFERAIETLALFKERGVKLRMINTVVHPGNIGQLQEMIPLVKNSGANLWHLSPAAWVGRAQTNNEFILDGKQLRDVADFIKKYRKSVSVDFGESYAYLWCLDGSFTGKAFFCGAGLVRCAVMPDGTVLGCHQVYDNKYSEGNIREKPFSRIWKEEFKRFRQPGVSAACKKCEYRNACNGGCWGKKQVQGACLKGAWGKPGQPTEK